MSESRSKAVQTDPTHPGRFHTLAVGDVFEATLRIIEEKLDRSLLDADLGNGGVQNISIQQPSVALPTGAAGLHPGNEETDEDATLRPTPLLPLSHVPAGAAVSTALAVLLPTIVTPTVQPPSPPIDVSPPSNGVSTGLEDEVPADTDTEVGGTRLAEEFEREVEALGRGVDALRQESGALLNGLRVVDTCHSPMRSPSQPHGQPHQHEHEQEEKLSTDLLDPDDDYGEISMELATPLHPTVTLPLPPSPSLPPSSPHTALLASFPPLPFSLPPASPSPIPSISPSPPPILPPNTVIRATSTGMAPAPMPLSMPSPSETAPNPPISLTTSAPHAPPALPTSTSPFLPSTPHPSPPSRPTATQQRMVSPLTSVFRSPSIKRSPNHSTELDDLQDRHPSGLPGVPGLPPVPPIRRDLDLDYPYAPHREDSSSRSRSVSPLRLSPPLDSAASVTSAVADVLGRDSSPPASPSLLSLASATSPVNVSLPPYADTGYTFQHFQRVEAELREMREALEVDEAERVALQGVLDGLVQDVVNGVFGGDGTGERG